MIEIMIVVGIIGLLAAVAIPNYVRSRGAAQQKACINNLRQIDGAIQEFATELKKSPTARVLESDITPYLKNAVMCPAGGTAFSDSYTVSTCNVTPECTSSGGGPANGHVLPQ